MDPLQSKKAVNVTAFLGSPARLINERKFVGVRPTLPECARMSNALVKASGFELVNRDQALKTLDLLENEIQSTDLDGLEVIIEKVEFIRHRFASVKDVADRAGEVWIAAEDRLGEELAKLPRAKGTAGKGRPKIGGAKTAPPKDDAPTLAELGLPGDAGKKRAARAKKIREATPAKRRKIIAKLKEDGKGVTPAAVLAELRKEKKAEKVHRVATAKFSENGPFDVVVIDSNTPRVAYFRPRARG